MESNAVAQYVVDHNIIQDLIFGFDIITVGQKHSVDTEYVVAVMDKSPFFTGLSTKHRKDIALARLDMMAKVLVRRAADGELSAIHGYLKVQEREAKLTGMDSPIKQDATITIDVPWLTRDRLSYKDSNGETIDNVTDIGPIIEVRKQVEQAQAWREGNPENGRNANVAMDDQVP